MKRYLVAPLLALSLLMTGCFTTIGAVRGSKHKEPDGSTNTGAVVGSAFLGALADTAVLFVIASWAYADALGGALSEESRQVVPSAPTPSPLSIPR